MSYRFTEHQTLIVRKEQLIGLVSESVADELEGLFLAPPHDAIRLSGKSFMSKDGKDYFQQVKIRVPVGEIKRELVIQTFLAFPNEYEMLKIFNKNVSISANRHHRYNHFVLRVQEHNSLGHDNNPTVLFKFVMKSFMEMGGKLKKAIPQQHPDYDSVDMRKIIRAHREKKRVRKPKTLTETLDQQVAFG